MCGRYGVTNERAMEIDARSWDLPIQVLLEGFHPRYNLAPTQQAPVLSRDGERLTLGLMRWGIIGSKGMHPNTMAESLGKWRSYFQGFGRVLVPVSFFYEWAMIGGRKRAYCIRPAEPEGLWWFAGVTKTHPLKDGQVTSFNIVTVPANADMEELHHRMPAILSREDQEAWLDPTATGEDLLARLRPAPQGILEAFEVGPAVGSVANEGSALIEPLRGSPAKG